MLLMERAGAGLADAVEAAMVRLGVTEAAFACGGGNNGGDGFVAARLLSERGRDVSVICLAEKFSPDCAAQKERFRGTVYGRIPRRRFPLLVDCVFGTGLSRAPSGESAALISFVNSCGGYVISCDLPSGLSENGIALEPCVKANETVCIGLLKNCLYLADGADVCGKISLVEIGLDVPQSGAEIWSDGDVARFFPKRKSNIHKGAFGSACILAGEAKYSGAPLLAVGACLKSGAGYTKLVAEESLYRGAIGKNLACVMSRYTEIDEEILSSGAIAIGMGAGVSEELYAQIALLLKRYRGKLVIDADGLNALAKYGIGILKEHACELVLTPHPKEFARLTECDVKDVLPDAVNLAQKFALEYGVTVILKNNRSIITNGERTAINPSGSPALAKGGSGDVLTGFLVGTCARGLTVFEAACVSCFVFGRAGELVCADMGEYSPDATDVISYFSKAILSILLK